jgi:hypothetical protein
MKQYPVIMPGILMPENLVILTVSRVIELAHTNSAMTSTIQSNDVCHECGQEFVPKGCAPGYALAMPNTSDKFNQDTAVKICYDCCGKRDAVEMARTGRFTGYLVFEECNIQQFRNGDARKDESENGRWKILLAASYFGGKREIAVRNIRVANWPGTLEFKVAKMTVGHHNIAGTRYDVWFTVVNVETGCRENWHGVQYGENTMICRCRRLKS